MKKYVKLVMVSTSNNNKFYEMVYDGKSSTFQATYGRIEKTSKTISKPYHDWDSVYDEKINKGNAIRLR